jgi:hypothetical protein
MFVTIFYFKYLLPFAQCDRKTMKINDCFVGKYLSNIGYLITQTDKLSATGSQLFDFLI